MFFVFFIFGCATKSKSKLESSDISKSFAEAIKIKNIKAKIILDHVGVPHVSADNDRDVFFAQGYAHAWLRLWQMETNSRTIESSLSEVLGATAIDTDELIAHFGIHEDAIRAHKTMMKDIETKTAMEAYVQGVNARISQLNPETWPTSFQIIKKAPRPFTTMDIVRIVYLMAWTSADPFDELKLTKTRSDMNAHEFAELFPWPGADLGHGLFGPAVPSKPSFKQFAPLSQSESVRSNYHKPWIDVLPNSGSNVILVPGHRMNDNNPVMVNDFHSAYRLPSAFLPMQLVSPTFNVVGSTIPGTIGVTTGNNGKVIWGRVLAQADISDWFRLKENSNRKYLWNKKWHEYQTETITIKVLNSKDHKFTRQKSEAGPMIPALKDGDSFKTLLYRWTGQDGHNFLKPILAQMKMKSASECGHPKILENMLWNVIACVDSDSNMGAWVAGRYPKRSNVYDPRLLSFAESAKDIWSDYFPSQKNPKLTQTKEPIVLANQHIFYKPDEPYIGWNFAPPYRALRISQLLSEKNNQMSMLDIHSMSSDIVSAKSLSLYPIFMKEAASYNNMNSCENEVIQELKHWDMKYTANSHLPALFNIWMNRSERNLWSTIIGDSSKYLWPNSWLHVELVEGKKVHFKDRAKISIRTGLSTMCQIFAVSGKKLHEQKWILFSKPQAISTISQAQHLLKEIYPSGSGTTVFTQGKNYGTVFRSITMFKENNQYLTALMGTIEEDTLETDWLKTWSQGLFYEVPYFKFKEFYE